MRPRLAGPLSRIAPPFSMLRPALQSACAPYPHSRHRNSLPSRFGAHVNPHAEHPWLVYAAATSSSTPATLQATIRLSSPQASFSIVPLSAAFCATFVPGFSSAPWRTLSCF